jgi:ATP-dependent RNA helicase SUPV3L1/SUV3
LPHIKIMSDRPTGQAPSRLVAVLGPTNTGKTHLAVERMLGHGSGMIGLPLRLLAREIYDRIVKARGARCVALITGEEKIIPPRPQYFVCTVEAMPLTREVDFLAVDEIQLCADPERGHVFTHRLLHARGKHETMLLGAATMAPLIRRLAPDAEIVSRERFSELSYAGSKKLTRLPRRSAVVAFSAEAVYAIAELIRRQRGGAAVVMGSLSPRTRNAQVALFQSGEVDFLVATDAIGMGLNMEVDHVAFAGLMKFDGRRTRWLHPQEIGQIGGRAGRYRTNGTFGVTGDCPEMDADLVQAVENHRFDPVVAAEWRSGRLDFSSLANLARSLSAPPPLPGLKLSEPALDETTLRKLADDDLVRRRVADRANLIRLWDVCQTPDFRKTTPEEHTRFVREMYAHLTERDRRLPTDWIDGQFKGLDRTDGDIDALSARLANVRTLAYVANRGDWLADPAHWQGRTRALEDRLSDTLHERLMQRFIDRRTSALMRGLNVSDTLLAGVASDGAVRVEGHYVGRLRGAHFDPAKGATVLEDRALRAAAERAVAPEIARRLGALAAEADDAFALQPNGAVLWRGDAAGQLTGGGPFSPRVRLFGAMGPEAARERAARRLEAFVAAEASRRLRRLRELKAAVSEGRIKGLARGLAYRLVEAGGVLARGPVEGEVRALSQAERRTLQALGVRFGAFALFLPALLEPDSTAFSAAFAHLASPHWRPAPEGLSALPAPAPPASALSAWGRCAIAGFAIGVGQLEQLAALLHAAPQEDGGAVMTAEALAALGWSEDDAGQVLRALGYSPTRKPKPGQPMAWRRRQPRKPDAQAPVAAASPFAALAGLAPPQRRPAPAKPRRKPRRAAAKGARPPRP